MIDYKIIGRRIAFQRKKAKMTQTVLAEKLNISDSFISQIERGRAKVSLPRLSQIADILDIDIALLVSDRNGTEKSNIPSEIEQIIQDWSKEQRSLLIDLILCVNQKMKPQAPYAEREKRH